ncbi:hypothetical protein AWN76_015605 [Rhodothermaceae bacterium RA]|nr:hypothetical protein AWN76_015605 [Rhodothermaceae bacterium RA]
MSVIFLYLSLDELGRMHEWIGSLFARMVGVTGMAAWYVWVVPFGILLICFAISYARFLLCMGPKHRGRIMGAGALYVGGALGMELVTAWHALNNQSDSLSHAMLTTLEETLEMAGLVVFVYALLEYLRCHAEAIQVHLVSPANHE